MPRLHMVVMRELLADIAMGEPAPGEMLPREVDLVNRFEVSRGVIRECIRGLEERGVISVKHGRGQTVTPTEAWAVLDPEVLQALLAAPDGEALLAEVLECERLLQVHAAGLAAARAVPEDVDALHSGLERLAEAASDVDTRRDGAARYRQADLDFHRSVLRASGNRALDRISAPLHRALTVAAERDGAAAGDPKRELADHRRIVAAIAEGDAAAARAAMERHLPKPSRRRTSARRRSR